MEGFGECGAFEGVATAGRECVGVGVVGVVGGFRFFVGCAFGVGRAVFVYGEFWRLVGAVGVVDGHSFDREGWGSCD